MGYIIEDCAPQWVSRVKVTCQKLVDMVYSVDRTLQEDEDHWWSEYHSERSLALEVTTHHKDINTMDPRHEGEVTLVATQDQRGRTQDSAPAARTRRTQVTASTQEPYTIGISDICTQDLLLGSLPEFVTPPLFSVLLCPS